MKVVNIIILENIVESQLPSVDEQLIFGLNFNAFSLK